MTLTRPHPHPVSKPTKLPVPPALGPGVQLVETADALEAAVSKLAGAEFFYLDTEFDSSRDGTRLSLIQVSRGAEIHLIDALELADLTPLARALGEPASTWVLHAGQQDVALLTARLGIPRPARVFDTQVVWALVTVEHSTALAYLKYRLLGLRGEKTHQADDWLRRPLPRAQLEYAADDVLHLPEIQRRLSARCAELGRERAALLASAEPLASNVEPPAPLTLDAFRNAWQLEHTGQAVLRFLIDWFNGLPLAERSTAPDQKGLLAIASRRPRSLEELGGLRAVPRRTVNLHGRTLLAGIERALSSADRAEFVAIDPPPYATIEEILAEGWLGALRAEVSAELGVAPELGFPARLMRRMREAAVEQGRVTAAAECLTGWRAEVLGAEFLARAGRFGALSKASSR